LNRDAFEDAAKALDASERRILHVEGCAAGRINEEQLNTIKTTPDADKTDQKVAGKDGNKRKRKRMGKKTVNLLLAKSENFGARGNFNVSVILRVLQKFHVILLHLHSTDPVAVQVRIKGGTTHAPSMGRFCLGFSCVRLTLFVFLSFCMYDSLSEVASSCILSTSSFFLCRPNRT